MEEKKVGFIQNFMTNAKNGFQLWSNNVVPAILFGYVVVQLLQFTGLMQLIGIVFTPILKVFGLPGEAATAIITGYLTLPAGCAAAAAMVAEGVLTGRQLTILFPMMYCVASQLLYIGRVLGTSGTEAKRYPVYIVIGIICAAVSGLIMNAIL